MEQNILRFGKNEINLYFGDKPILDLKNKIDLNNTLLVTDNNVFNLYSKYINDTFCGAKTIVVDSGEESKNLECVQKILACMVENKFNRKSSIIAFGGGVIGDLAGFCASIYMRGIDLYQIPTTLLSQVDSGVGGKTGVNFLGFKNIVGSFYQPKSIYICQDFLKTLNSEEVLCGYGEVVKSALLDSSVFDLLTKQEYKQDFLDIENLIHSCIAFKARIVGEDEKEGGIRKILNLGHTMGHAFEELNLYGDRRHGEFVLIGLYYELKMSLELGLISKENHLKLQNVVMKFLKDIPKINDVNVFYNKLIMDKKNVDSKVSFIFLKDLFDTCEVLLTKEEIIKLIEKI